jgi:hypothetical protein
MSNDTPTPVNVIGSDIIFDNGELDNFMASSNKLMKSLKENTDDRAVPQEAGAEHAACYQSIDDKVLEYLRKVSANLREDTP